MKLTESNMLGNWKGRNVFVSEFQVGKILIFVEYLSEKEKESRLSHANGLINEVLKYKEKAVELAIDVSKVRNPDFWASVESCSVKQDILTIFSIRFPSDKHEPLIEISWNPIFQEETVFHEDDYFKDDPIKVTELPENEEFIDIIFTESGELKPTT
jgi:hypothetical protein